MKHIVLIHPANDASYATPWIRENKCPPTGLLLLATVIMKFFPEYLVRVIDSPDDQEYLRTMIKDANVVGVTSIYTNHQNCLSILREAKLNGSETWMGGANATVLAKQILTKHPFVDYVFLGDAEEAVISLLQETACNNIPNLAHRDQKGQPVTNPIHPVSPQNIFALSPLLGLENVDRNAPFNISSIRGCVKALQQKRCSHCALQHRTLRLMQPKLVWKQIGLLHRHGFRTVEESGDCLLVGRYPQQLVDYRPDNLREVKWKGYAHPEQITPESLDTLKALNVEQVFLGVESLEDRVLAQANRCCTKRDIFQAVNQLADAGIGIHFPIIWGLPGTTRETLKENMAFARYVKNRFEQAGTKLEFLSSWAVPIAGSDLFANLINDPRVINDYPGKLRGNDIIDYRSLIRSQTEYHTSVTTEEISEYMAEMQRLHPRIGGFGV